MKSEQEVEKKDGASCGFGGELTMRTKQDSKTTVGVCLDTSFLG